METDPEMTKMMELSDKYIEMAIINLLHVLGM